MITKNNGFEFLDFLVVKEAEMFEYQRLAGSYAVIKSNEKYLLCYNRLRKQWELPAGHREENETPIECAIRELYEETGQRISNLEFKGLLKSKNISNGEFKYNPVYFTTLFKLQLFKQNSETSEIRLWDLQEDIGCIDEVDSKLIEYLNLFRVEYSRLE